MINGLDFSLPTRHNASSIIKVVGVGGGGGNAVQNMMLQGIEGVDFIVCNTDKQVLDRSTVPNKVQLGSHLTRGLGAGGKPEVGRESAVESMDEIRDLLADNTRMLFITAGMGGGTGTGAAPVIARAAKELGILTVAIVTVPFDYEGPKRLAQAREGLAELEAEVDSMIVINNNNLLKICPPKMKAKEAYIMADNVLYHSTKGISDIINRPGLINVDFEDVRSIMAESGTALMGMASSSGDNRAKKAALEAISSPLLDNVNINGATGLLVNITANEDSFEMTEMTEIMETITAAVGNNATIIHGCVLDSEETDRISVTVIATGFGTNTAPQTQNWVELEEEAPRQQPVQAPPVQPQQQYQQQPAAQRPVPPPVQPAQQPQYHQQPALRQQPVQKPAAKSKSNQPASPSWDLFNPPAETNEPPRARSIEEEVEQMQHLYNADPEHTHVSGPIELELEVAPAAPRPVNMMNEGGSDYRPRHQPNTYAGRPSHRMQTPDERMANFRRESYDYHNQGTLDQLEREPAYMRRDVDISRQNAARQAYSNRVQVQYGSDGRVRLNDQNSYLYDNVD